MIEINNSHMIIKDNSGNTKFNTALNMPKLISTSYTSLSLSNISLYVVVSEVVNGSAAGFAASYVSEAGSIVRTLIPNVQYQNRFCVVYVKSSNSLLKHPSNYILCNGSIVLDIINTYNFSAVSRRDNNGTNGARVLHTNITDGSIIFTIDTMFNYRFGNSIIYGVNGIDSFPPNNLTSSSDTSSYTRTQDGHYGIALSTSGSNTNPQWELLNTNNTLTFMIKEYAW